MFRNTVVALFATLIIACAAAPSARSAGWRKASAPVEAAASTPSAQSTVKAAKRLRRSMKLAATLHRFFPKAFDTREADPIGTDGYAIASLCCGIGGLFVLPILGSIAAIILGVIALNRIKESGQRGHGMAVAGIIIGAVSLLLYGAYIFLLLAFV